VADLNDIIHYQLLAKEARRRADSTEDPDLARRYREIAVKHERAARKLAGETEGQ
jgi:hypothetical protein